MNDIKEWKLVPVEPTAEMVEAGCQGYMKADGSAWVMHPSSMDHAYYAMLAAAPTPPNPIACHVDESCGQGGGEVEDIGEDAIRDLASSACQSALYEGVNEEAFARLARTVASRAHAHVTRLTAELAHVRHLMTDAYNCGVAEAKENDALKAEVERLNGLVASQTCVFCNDSGQLLTTVKTLQSRLTQATALIDYVEQHIELDAILVVDIPAFREGAAPTPTGEVADLKAEVERLQQLIAQSRNDADEADRLRHVAQSDLTKARELLTRILGEMPTPKALNSLRRDAADFLVHQSAPAAKGGE